MGRGNVDRNPDGAAEQLSFAEAPEEPVGYRLTARARRIVAPASMPDLAVITAPDDVEELDLHDARPARARALRRSGRAVEEIAADLGVGVELVADWCQGVTPRRRRRRPPAASAPPPAGRAVPLDDSERAAAGGGLVAGLAELSRHAVTFTLSERALAAAVVGWLTAHGGAEPTRIRVILEVGGDLARDITAHAWARELGIPLDQVTATVWQGASSGDALRTTVRVADPEVVAKVAGWRRALLG